KWVQMEMGAALSRFLRKEPCRLVPVRLDITPIPSLLSSIRYIDASSNQYHLRVARELLGITSEAAFRLAVQEFIDEAHLDFEMFHGAGVFVGCPKCGATPDNLEGFEEMDHRSDRYVGARCTVCSWSAASEM